MKRFLLAPDSFKGTMTASEVCDIQRAAILSLLPDAEIAAIPMADGGEGMTAAYLRILGGTRVTATVTGPLGKPVEGFYGLLPDGGAVIEMAAAAGLPFVGDAPDPLCATTYGVGELMQDALLHGANRILLGLGGSATNDGGVGMAAALGWRFYDTSGQRVEPLAKNMERIARIEQPARPFPVPVTAACDVNNPLLGARGATVVFGPQKGVTDETRPLLERGLRQLMYTAERTFGISVCNVPGAGAAGGLGAGVLAFLGGSLVPGIELLLDTARFDERVREVDAVFTGEGRMDRQSAFGKVPMGVGERCKRANVPCIALCGSLGDGAEEMAAHGITAAFSAVRGAADFAQIQQTCREDMYLLTQNVVRLLCAGAKD